jgi:hypothetical protein
MTIHGIHCAALRTKTVITGAVARFRGIDKRRVRGGVVDRGIGGRGIVTDFITKMIDLRLERYSGEER